MSRRHKPIYRLKKEEDEYCRQLAAVRNDTKAGKIEDRRIDQYTTSFEVNLKHIRALYAVARFLGCYLPSPQSLAPPKSTSFLEYREQQVAVRFNNTAGGDFYLPDHHQFVFDFAVLCYTAPMARWPEPNLPGIQIAGWLTKADWAANARQTSYGPNKVWAVSERSLRDFDELLHFDPGAGIPEQPNLFPPGNATATPSNSDR